MKKAYVKVFNSDEAATPEYKRVKLTGNYRDITTFTGRHKQAEVLMSFLGCYVRQWTNTENIIVIDPDIKYYNGEKID